MKYKIVVDSCCDLTTQLKEEMDINSIPLTMRLGDREYIDNELLDMDGFMQAMKECNEKVGSTAPAPAIYQQSFEQPENIFAITLSSKLSCSYSNAIIAKNSALEKVFKKIHVFDSKSASAGECLIAMKIHDMIMQKHPSAHIIQSVNTFIENMKTYFVLENYDNLKNNGRLSGITCKIANILNIKLIMGADGGGNIKLFAKPRGIKQMIDRMLGLIRESGKNFSNENIVISHCDNYSLAKQLSDTIKNHFKFKNVFIVPTGGVSSLYASSQGVIVAF